MTSVVLNALIELGAWFKPYQYQAAMAIVATLLVLFGNQINSHIKKMFSRYHFVVRTIAFVVVCAFGYGLATVWLTGLLHQQLAKVPLAYLVPVHFVIFTGLGMYAQKQRHI
ncbi:DUF3392 domain-containing protein [Thalassotalea sp. LPB0316]|uniref:DUF3392 domain-containing protein n=1 Tax=Thalassotalea sp. LPB0316 TaxID=2769490 RepID=UPI001868E29A|nr:DUF3392 domain-containing protein [Thalassotalea sp. LPB0316]QOL25264.1 DUF3392 domain-containing protein [Thalassotalea sp. LPB0316]